MKKNSFLKIRIIIVTNIYIVCALSGALSGVLSSGLFGVLSGNCRALHSTPQNSSVFILFFKNNTFTATHKKEGFISYIKNNMSRWIGFHLPFWPGSSAHQERKASNEIRQNRTIYGDIY